MIKVINGIEYCFYPSTNQGVIRRIVNHEEIKSYLFLNPPEQMGAFNLKKMNDPNFVIYIVRVNTELAGIGIFEGIGKDTRVDNAFFPKFRGRHAKVLANLVILDYLNTHSVRALIGKIRKTNKRSLVFAYWNNFRIVSSDDTYFYVEREANGRFITKLS